MNYIYENLKFYPKPKNIHENPTQNLKKNICNTKIIRKHPNIPNIY